MDPASLRCPHHAVNDGTQHLAMLIETARHLRLQHTLEHLWQYALSCMLARLNWNSSLTHWLI